ncbi:MutS-related protein [Clostridium tyrobutyricum]|uniref:MutS-related protein n=1 Tax=Clostridium tyrobutyricum TaxID=1519 RepID=UPI001C390D63|nr:DNA mismatch repair protein [Clostridium tyrobutyricum]MBV4427356.1 DNA mismatch repair protein [Clostridium tyrobutyricum]MBV4443494.1 DNA mismatch repair protein [Clostridium tyrobutyricum]
MKNIRDIYTRRKNHYNSLLKRQNKYIKLVSRFRLAIFLLGVIGTIYLYTRHYIYMSLSCFLVFLILFIVFVKIHERLNKNLKFTEKLSSINKTCIDRIDGKWNKFKENGKEFKDENHAYSYDLDLFGENSIFQWINTTETYLGKKKLFEILTSKPDTKNTIIKRQKAIDELSSKIKFRQRLQAEGYFAKDDENKLESLINVIKPLDNSIYSNGFIIALFKILPVIIIGSLVMTFVLKIFSSYIGYSTILISILILFIGSKNRFKQLDTVFKLKKGIKAYESMINIIYNTNFSSQYLNQIKTVFKNDNTKKKSNKKSNFRQMTELTKIANNISDRKNMAYIILNILFLWDYQCMFAIEKWRRKNGPYVYSWINAVAEIEMLSSLSVINFDHSNWTIPKIYDESLKIRAKSMAHPLIRGKAISNNLDIDSNSRVLLITGSNMSGKSTFLRTTGVNLLLAYLGTHVCAEYFNCSIMNLYTCMRISDNLEKNISSFYGEIIRIKSIVEAAKRGERIFFLLDEIFKGTNSIDRHTGAKILINELKSLNTCGMVSTHDLELCDMENENNGHIKNYYFREYYKNNKIFFDYKLQRGISKTRNALYLMKMAGIDIPDTEY